MNEVSQPPGRGRIVVAWLALATALFLCALWAVSSFLGWILSTYDLLLPNWFVSWGIMLASLAAFLGALSWVGKVCSPVSRHMLPSSLHARLRRFATYGFKRVVLQLFLTPIVLSIGFYLLGCFLPELQFFTTPASVVLVALMVWQISLRMLIRAFMGLLRQ